MLMVRLWRGMAWHGMERVHDSMAFGFLFFSDAQSRGRACTGISGAECRNNRWLGGRGVVDSARSKKTSIHIWDLSEV